ncbi:MAG: D-alanyl-D-alanine carboxypeptidase DacC [Chlamydiae bacterium]|nr:D-alanyl-D-alanine carboxypeptidase DacC [Chlamydiota bacterium]
MAIEKLLVGLHWQTMNFLKAFVAAIILASPHLLSVEHSQLSYYAVRCDTGEVLLDRNSDLSLLPGSCLKIATTAAALHLLGADSCFETHLEYDGAIGPTKTLHGNLYIRGGGDPCLGSDRARGALSWKKQIVSWADAIQALGIDTIEGSVIGDATKWEKALAVPSWSWEDLGNYYGAGACALSFHENAYSLFFQPGDSLEDNAKILRTDPPLSHLSFQNEVTTGPEGSGDRACIYGSEFSPTQFVRGTIPAGVMEFSIRGSIPDPAACCASLLKKELIERGIPIKQQNVVEKTKRTSFHTTHSPPIKEIVYWANQKSINLYAEHLLKKMGEVSYNDGSTASGINAVTAFWNSQNVDLGGFNMVDGSGLSRKNMATAKQLVGMLLKVKNSKAFPIFLESLPQYRFTRAKSGSMSLQKCFVGYSGDIAFAILINQCPSLQEKNEKLEAFFSELKRLNSHTLFSEAH